MHTWHYIHQLQNIAPRTRRMKVAVNRMLGCAQFVTASHRQACGRSLKLGLLQEISVSNSLPAQNNSFSTCVSLAKNKTAEINTSGSPRPHRVP
jgi:hypothetical protein